MVSNHVHKGIVFFFLPKENKEKEAK